MAMPYSTRYDRDSAAKRRADAAVGLTGDLAAQAAANPYVGREFTPNLFQHLGEVIFGDYSARDNFYMQQDQSADEYLAQLLDTQRQQAYNDPSAVARRERNAGLNTDLTGAGDSSQPAVGASPDDTPPAMPETSMDLNPLLSAAMGFLSPTGILEAGLSIWNAAEQNKSVKTKRVNDELTSFLDQFGKVPGVFAGLAPTEAVVVDDSGTVRLDASKLDSMYGDSGLSKAAKKRLKKMAGLTSYDENGNTSTAFQEAFRKLRASSLENGQKIVQQVNSPGYSESLSEWSIGYNESVGAYQRECLGYLAEAEKQKAKLMVQLYSDDANRQRYETELSSLESQQQFSEYQADFFNKLDPQVSADAQKSEEFARRSEAIARRAATKIDAATEKQFSDQLDAIDNNPNLDPQAKRDLKNGILIKRNEWYNERLSEKVKAGKVIGSSDWLNAGSSLLNTATGALIGKIPGTQVPGLQYPQNASFTYPYNP